ncbi:class I tRNA ligase family protein [Shigella flexneri]
MLTDQWYVRPSHHGQDRHRGGGRSPAASSSSKAVRKHVLLLDAQRQDWCVSRQLWSGHRIPAWYDDPGNVYVGATKRKCACQARRPVRDRAGQDEDVLDTWFSSALLDLSTLG